MSHKALFVNRLEVGKQREANQMTLGGIGMKNSGLHLYRCINFFSYRFPNCGIHQFLRNSLSSKTAFHLFNLIYLYLMYLDNKFKYYSYLKTQHTLTTVIIEENNYTPCFTNCNELHPEDKILNILKGHKLKNYQESPQTNLNC